MSAGTVPDLKTKPGRPEALTAAGAVSIILLLIVPLPHWMLDVLLASIRLVSPCGWLKAYSSAKRPKVCPKLWQGTSTRFKNRKIYEVAYATKNDCSDPHGIVVSTILMGFWRG